MQKDSISKENAVQIFENPQFGNVRVVMSESNEPWFCALDIAKALGYKEPKQAVAMHCKSGKLVYCPHPNTVGGTQVKFTRESDVYRLIMKSELPSAEKFQDWVCEEVLPSIRKHGMYATELTIDKLLDDPDFAIQALQNLKAERQKRLEAEAKVKESAPAVHFTESVTCSNTYILIRDLAKLLCQNGHNIGEVRLYDWMVRHKYLIRTERWSKKRQKYISDYMPTQKAAELKIFFVSETIISTGEAPFIKHTVKVTGKGQVYFLNKFSTLKQTNDAENRSLSM